MNKINTKFSVESIMVTLLLILFATAICIILYQGSITYKSIINNKEHQENSRIALSYINMKIKENDVARHISVTDNGFNNNDVLTIKHHGEEEGLKSYIYCYKGKLYECYTDGELQHEYGVAIIEADNVQFHINDRGQIETTIDYYYKDNIYKLVQINTLRSK